MNELPIQQYYVLPYDRWEGYEAERQQVLRALQNVKHVVFLTTDVHATLVNDARFETLDPGGPRNSGILDITVVPAATANLELEIKTEVGVPGTGALADSAFFEPAAAGRRREALLDPRPVQLRPGEGHREPADDHAQGHQRAATAERREAVRPFVLNYTKSEPPQPFLCSRVVRDRACLRPGSPATLALAAPASAARSVPHGFVGVTGARVASAPADAQDAQWDVMASSGIESVRADFSWPTMQGRRGEPLDFTRSDALVRRATLRNVSLLPVVNEAPRWARAYKRREKSPPRLNSDYASFIAGSWSATARAAASGPRTPPCRSGRCASGRSGTSRTCARTGTPPRRAAGATRLGTASCCAAPTGPSRCATPARRWSSRGSPSAPGRRSRSSTPSAASRAPSTWPRSRSSRRRSGARCSPRSSSATRSRRAGTGASRSI